MGAALLSDIVLVRRLEGGGLNGGTTSFGSSIRSSPFLFCLSIPQQPLLRYAYIVIAGIITTSPTSTNIIARSNLGAK